MASELRVNSSTNRSGLGTITYTDSGPIVSGVGTFTNGFTVDGTQTTVKSLKLTGDNYNANWFKTSDKLRFNDNAKATFGTSDDLSIWHNGTHTYIQESGAGALQIRGTNLILDNADGSKRYIDCNDGGSVELYFNGAKKLETVNTGINLTGGAYATGTITAGSNIKANTDGGKLAAGASDDLQIYHSTFNYIESHNDAEIHINANTGGSVENMAKFKPNGAVELYHDGTKKLETTASSVTLSDNLVMGNHHIELNDNSQIMLGNAPDMRLYHDGSHSYITNTTGDLTIVDESRIKLRTDQFVVNNHANDESIIYAAADGEVSLYHNGNKRFDTTGSGIKVTGRADPAADSAHDLGTNGTRWRTAYLDTLNVSANGNNTNGSVANFRGGVYNQINIAHANNSGWGLLLTNTDQTTYGNNTGYHYSTNTGVNKPCAVVNVNSDTLHFATANTSRFFLTHVGHFLPYANNSYDIGSSTNKVRNIYTNDLHLSNEGSTNSVDNTWGDYTIQEGESDLFLINNRSGKKYKFNLTEVS